MTREESLRLLQSVYEDIKNMTEEDIDDFNNTVREYKKEQIMAREKMLRAWSKLDKKMFIVIGYDLVEDKIWSYQDCYSFDEVVLMQYTELKDKNGIEICESDIVRKFSNINKFTDSFAKFIEPTFTTTLIVRDEGAFKTTYNGEPDSILNHNSMSMVKHMEVIGNIYENPELLEG